jgi:hypothetical protein
MTGRLTRALCVSSGRVNFRVEKQSERQNCQKLFPITRTDGCQDLFSRLPSR